VQEAVENGVLNAIIVANNCRMKPNLIDRKPPHNLEDIARVVNNSVCEDEDVKVNITYVRPEQCDQILPSKLLD
jgi:hypothetical protein